MSGTAAMRHATATLLGLPRARTISYLAVGRLVVVGLPLAFVVVSWFAGSGFPYYVDNNETFLSYVHARNLEIWNPGEYGWLTVDGSDPLQFERPPVYSHNPNAPRYLHYLLLKAGVRDLSAHVLILGLLGTALTVLVLWRTFGTPSLIVVALAVVLDYTGFLAWTVNTYRIWTLVLFFGLVLTTARARPLWAAIFSFGLFQIEYGFALFAAVTVALLAVLTYRWRAWRLILAFGTGSGLSLAVFAAQVLTLYGWAGFVHELAITYARRGADSTTAGAGLGISQALDGVFQLDIMMVNVTYGPAVVIVTMIGLMLAARALLRGHPEPAGQMVARLTVATFVGVAVTAALLHGYFVDAFVRSLLPLPTLLIAPAMGMVALEARRLFARRVSWPPLGALCGALVLMPLVVASTSHVKAPVAADLFAQLQNEYGGRTILAPSHGGELAVTQLAFALTGGRGVATSDIEATPDDVRRFEPLRDADGTLTYLCLDTVYVRWSNESEALNQCAVAETRMLARGHQEIASGAGWVLIQVNREP
jgi:hypothetical protein